MTDGHRFEIHSAARRAAPTAGVNDMQAREQAGSFRDLLAWQKAFDLGLSVYDLTCEAPDLERLGLVTALRMNAATLAGAIAEGFAPTDPRDALAHLNTARLALRQLDAQLHFAKRLGYLDPARHREVQSRHNTAAAELIQLMWSIDETIDS
jgi:four helix bundle protein